MVHAEHEDSARNGQRKRKHEGGKTDDKSTKAKSYDTGESSGTTWTEEDNCRGSVGPNPLEAP